MPVTASHWLKKLVNWTNDPAKRKWVYDVAASLGAVAIFYGVLTSEEVAVWLGVVTTLTNGLARQNVS